MEKNFFIPEMEQSELISWYRQISPIVRKDGNAFYLRPLSDSEVSRTAYTWLTSKRDYGKAVDYTKLEELAVVQMLHSYGYRGFFKPSVSEVIRQIPEELLPQTVAFEIIYQPSSEKDLMRFSEETAAGFHVSTVRLYKSSHKK